LLDDFVNFVNNYKTKYEILIFSTIRRLETIITISRVSISTFLINTIVLVLSSKKRDRSSKIIENAFISKKREQLSKIKTTTSNKQDNNVEIFF